MQLASKSLNYQWVDNWSGSNGLDGFSHNDVVIDRQGHIYISFNTKPYLRIFSPKGELIRAANFCGPTMHCLFLSYEDGQEWLWNIELDSQTLNKCTLDGDVVATIDRNAFDVQDDEKLMFTAGAWDPATGNIWIADGYGPYAQTGTHGGASIYCFGPDLKLKFRFNGSSDPCGALEQPHWIYADQRKGYTEIYITDRSNHRIVVYDAEGGYLRTITEGLNTPSAIGGFDDKLVVAELEGRIHVLNAQDEIIETLGDGSEYKKCDGWPNRKSGGETQSPVPALKSGKLNSPHGMAVASDGTIYVHEWLMGTRITKFQPV